MQILFMKWVLKTNCSKLKNILLSALFISCSFVNAQVDSISKEKIKFTRFEMETGYGSNHLTGTTALPFAFKSAISNEDIENSSTLLFNTNRTGSESHILAHFEVSKHRFQVSYNSIVGLSYSKNLYELAFKGNSAFAGKKMDLQMSAKQLTYAKIKYELSPWKMKEKMKDGKVKKPYLISHGISLYGITKYSRAKTNGDNFLFTSESVTEVEGQFNYEYQANQQTALKGGGVGWSTYAYQRKGSTIKVLQIENLGVGVIASGEQIYTHDTAWKYRGINFTIGSGSSFSGVGDSVSSLIYKENKSKARLILLPVDISYSVQSPKYNYGVQYIAMPGYLPQIHWVKKIYTKKDNTAGIGFQAGGWGLVNSYLQYNLFLKGENTRKIHFQMLGIESLLLPYPSFGLKMRLDM